MMREARESYAALLGVFPDSMGKRFQEAQGD